MVYSTRRFVLSLASCYIVLVLSIPFSTAITSLGEERAKLSVLRTFVRFALVTFCLFPLPLGFWERLWPVTGTSWTFLLPFLFVPHFYFLWCLGMAMFRDCGISWVSLLIYLQLTSKKMKTCFLRWTVFERYQGEVG